MSSPDPNQPQLLLSSLAVFWSVLEPLLESSGAQNICEIGVSKGEFTEKLITFCTAHSGQYTGIDPSANDALVSRFASSAARFIKRPSLEALLELPAHDVYFIDGDHNYHTVFNELRLIMECGRAQERLASTLAPPATEPEARPTNSGLVGRAYPRAVAPLIILHDVCWPWARRDQYCDPNAIPESARHPHSSELGAMPDREELGAGGFSGATSDYPYSVALREGGPKNGVLTAVEDFLHAYNNEDSHAHEQWRLLILPVIFGLGILYAPQKCSAQTLAALDRLEKSIPPLKELLEIIERNRVELVLANTRHISELEKVGVEYRKLHDHAHGLQSKYEELFEKYGDLMAHYKLLEADRDRLLKK